MKNLYQIVLDKQIIPSLNCRKAVSRLFSINKDSSKN